MTQNIRLYNHAGVHFKKDIPWACYAKITGYYHVDDRLMFIFKGYYVRNFMNLTKTKSCMELQYRI